MQIDPTADLGSSLRRARLAAGLGLREVARLAGTSHATLNAYETNRKVPSIHTFVRILQACRYTVDVSLTPTDTD